MQEMLTRHMVHYFFGRVWVGGWVGGGWVGGWVGVLDENKAISAVN